MGNEVSGEAGGAGNEQTAESSLAALDSTLASEDDGSSAAAAASAAPATGEGSAAAAAPKKKKNMSKTELLKYKNSIGQRVEVEGYGAGVLGYFGLHSSGQGVTCGVNLDEPNGNMDGRSNGFVYFKSQPNHGILCSPRTVTLMEAPMALELQAGGVIKALASMNAAGDAVPQSAAAAASSTTAPAPAAAEPGTAAEEAAVVLRPKKKKKVQIAAEFEEMTNTEQKTYIKFEKQEQKKLSKTLKELAKKKRVTAAEAALAVANFETERLATERAVEAKKKPPKRRTSEALQARMGDLDASRELAANIPKRGGRSLIEEDVAAAKAEMARLQAIADAEAQRVGAERGAEQAKAAAERQAEEQRDLEAAMAAKAKADTHADVKALLAKTPRKPSGQLVEKVETFTGEVPSVEVVKSEAFHEAERLKEEAAGLAKANAGKFQDPAQFVPSEVTPNQGRTEVTQLEVDAANLVDQYNNPVEAPVQPNASRAEMSKLDEQANADAKLAMFADIDHHSSRPIEKAGLADLQRLKYDKMKAEKAEQARQQQEARERAKTEKQAEETAAAAAKQAEEKKAVEEAEAAAAANKEAPVPFGGAVLKKADSKKAVHPMVAQASAQALF